jgi:hypothetical protein
LSQRPPACRREPNWQPRRVSPLREIPVRLPDETQGSGLGEE